jgi:MFS-type transporter involved in bile tolerance (Atg22 family)
MPLVGAIVDHTQYRKHMGIIGGILVVGVTGLQVMINEDPNNWFLILILDSIHAFSYSIHVPAVFAYLPDLRASPRRATTGSSTVKDIPTP